MRDYTHPADLVHVGAIAVAAALVVVGGLRHSSPSFAAVIRGILTFNIGLEMPVALFAGLLLASAILAYVPFSHMAHFIAKYFTYHSIRWDDAPNVDGQTFAKSTSECLGMRPTWSAKHMQADGTKTWSEIAAANPALVEQVRR